MADTFRVLDPRIQRKQTGTNTLGGFINESSPSSELKLEI